MPTHPTLYKGSLAFGSPHPCPPVSFSQHFL
jgi:hypothetical protein